jgi:hypothetical protein
MILIWDTCALNGVCRAIAHHITHTAAPGTAPTKQAEFLQRLEAIIVGLRARCGYVSHTTDVVFAIEVDPTAVDSKLRDQDDLLECYCAEATFVEAWQSILEHGIASETVDDGEIEALRGMIRPDPGQRDVSLIVVALKLGTQTGQNCVIVTDDISLTERINELRRNRREVFLEGQQHSTSRITAKLSLEILRELYLSCGLDHDFWHSTLFSFKLHNNGHYGQAGRKHLQHVLAFFSQLYTDRAEKERGCLGAELGSIFGVDNA